MSTQSTEQLETASETPSNAAHRLAATLEMSQLMLQDVDADELLRGATSLLVTALEADFGVTGALFDGGEGIELNVVGDERESRPYQFSYCKTASFAISSEESLISNDFGEEERFKDLFLRERSAASGLTIPVVAQGHATASVEIYWTQQQKVSRADVDFAETITHMAASALTHAELQKRLVYARRFQETLMASTQSLVFTLDSDDRITSLNEACRSISGFSLDELRGRSFMSVFVAPEELGAVRAAIRRGQETATPTKYESYLVAKSGERRRVSWSRASLIDSGGNIESIVLTGVDVTPRSDVEMASTAAESFGDPEQVAMPAFKGTEQRDGVRRSFPYRQGIAPYVNDKMPEESDYVEVGFRDISAGGVSFLTSDKPDFEQVIIALGSSQNVTLVAAEVMHVDTTQRDGRLMYLVGCRFLRRIAVSGGG
jgi:PAS domain S-box-containing protein